MVALVYGVLLVTYSINAFATVKDHAARDEIRRVFDAYVEDFVAKDIDGIANHFSQPVLFGVDEPQVAQDRNGVKAAFADIFANIQTGYAYSTVESFQLDSINQRLYNVQISYNRYNNKGEIIHSGESVYFFKPAEDSWRIYHMAILDEEG